MGPGGRKRKKSNRDTSPHILRDENGQQCFKTFVQATKRNKDVSVCVCGGGGGEDLAIHVPKRQIKGNLLFQRIFNQIDKLQAHGIADMTVALEMAFKTFNDVSVARFPSPPSACQ